MSDEEENILNRLLSSGTYLDRPECSEYLNELGSFGLPKVSREPDRLREEKKCLMEQIQESAFSNYKTFIQASECSRDLFDKFNCTRANLDGLATKLPQLSTNCHDLGVVSAQVETSRKLNALVLNKNSQLLELLELPQLMESCIRNGDFEEAFELSSYVRRLGKKHGNIALISNIVEEFNVSWQAMLHQLLTQLRTDLQLPKCLQIVSYLRRMEVYTEAELRVKFLQARDTWLQSVLLTIPKTDGIQHMLKTIELSRIHLFNIITQYRAIFSDHDPVTSVIGDSDINEASILYSWITEKIADFVRSLDEGQLRRNPSALESVLVQAMYFGQSFSRVGFDFRAVLVPKFLRVIQHDFETAVRNVNKSLEADLVNMDVCKISGRAVTNIPQAGDTKPEQPPMGLLEFPPLAKYLNGLLDAFNDLRVCAPLAVASHVTGLLQESLQHCTKIILFVYRRDQQGYQQSERDKFALLCGGFRTLVAFVEKCVHLIFPPQDVVLHIGIPLHQLQKEGVTFINEAAILEPLCHLMPIEAIGSDSTPLE